MCCRSCRSIFGGKLGYGSEVKKIRFMTPVDGVYGVIDSGVQDRKAARGMHGCRLGTRSANNHEKRSVPLDNRIDRVGRGLLRIPWLIMERSGITTGDLCRKTRAEKHQCDHILWHRDYSFLFFSKHSMVRHAMERSSSYLVGTVQTADSKKIPRARRKFRNNYLQQKGMKFAKSTNLLVVGGMDKGDIAPDSHVP